MVVPNTTHCLRSDPAETLRAEGASLGSFVHSVIGALSDVYIHLCISVPLATAVVRHDKI